MEKTIPIETKFQLWLAISWARHILYRARQKELSPYYLTPRQAYLLFIIHNLGGNTSLSELSKHSHRGVSSLSVQLTRMEKDGLVKKIKERPKSNILKYDLTRKGIEAYYASNRIASIDKIMSVLSEEEVKTILAILIIGIREAQQFSIAKAIGSVVLGAVYGVGIPESFSEFDLKQAA